MINQITCNSNNAIQLSRGQLLNWLNNLLKTNIAKIEQLGTGAIYCQLLQIIYPGKVPLSKVNPKAKLDYEYLNNFKILQQSFTKLNIMKHIDVEKLVKCKYQDNLQFLQWFKKIFDNTGGVREFDGQRKLEKENRFSSHEESMNQSKDQDGKKTPKQQREPKDLKQPKELKQPKQQKQTEKKAQKEKDVETKFMAELKFNMNDDKLHSLIKEQQDGQKKFYLKKISQIQHLMQKWDCSKGSAQLITDIRKILLVVPDVDWSVETGTYQQK